MTAAERLRSLAGISGTAAALLLVIGSGVTAGAALVDYSGLPSATAAQHLLADVEQQQEGNGTGGSFASQRSALPVQPAPVFASFATETLADNVSASSTAGTVPPAPLVAPADESGGDQLRGGAFIAALLGNDATAGNFAAGFALPGDDARESLHDHATEDQAALIAADDDELALLLILLEASA